MMIRQLLKRFGRNRDGVAAVEFAITSVVLAGLVVGMLDGFQYAREQTAAQAAVNAGALYYLQGGTSDAAAQEFALAAWHSRPSSAEITVDRLCSCDGAAHECSTLCDDLTVPHTQITVSATATLADSLVTHSVHAREIARVR